MHFFQAGKYYPNEQWSINSFLVQCCGALVTISLAIFGTATFGGLGIDNVGDQILTQIKGVGAVLIWSAAGTYIIVKICQAITGLRVSDDDIQGGLDQAEHGEISYNF